jgi:hypothetical protein
MVWVMLLPAVSPFYLMFISMIMIPIRREPSLFDCAVPSSVGFLVAPSATARHVSLSPVVPLITASSPCPSR